MRRSTDAFSLVAKKGSTMSIRPGFVPVLAILLVLVGSACKSQSIVSHTFIIHYVVAQKQVDYIVGIFRNRLLLQDPQAEIIGCNNVTRISRDGAKDFSVGAVCGVRSGDNRFTLLVCENSRFGGFTETESEASTREEVIQFTEGNCLNTGRR